MLNIILKVVQIILIQFFVSFTKKLKERSVSYILVCDSLSCHSFWPFQATPPSMYFTRYFEFWNQAYKFSVSDVLHTTVRCLHLSRKHLTIAVHINCAPVIFSSPALHGYATLRVFRCIIRVSWDLIKITASEIPFKWKCSQKTMADTSSYRLFLFSAHQQGKANPCFHDGRQEGHKLCCFLTLLMLFLSELPNN